MLKRKNEEYYCLNHGRREKWEFYKKIKLNKKLILFAKIRIKMIRKITDINQFKNEKLDSTRKCKIW